MPGAVVRFGDWGRAIRVTRGMRTQFARAVEVSVMREAHYLRGLVVQGITSGAPAGQPFKPWAPLTVALRGGKGKILILSGALRASITVVRIRGGADAAAFVGVQRTAPRANVADVHERGATITVTPKMRRYLWARLREVGGGAPGAGTSYNSPGVAVIRIPARPYIGPVLERYGRPEASAARFWKSMGDLMFR